MRASPWCISECDNTSQGSASSLFPFLLCEVVEVSLIGTSMECTSCMSADAISQMRCKYNEYYYTVVKIRQTKWDFGVIFFFFVPFCNFFEIFPDYNNCRNDH